MKIVESAKTPQCLSLKNTVVGSVYRADGMLVMIVSSSAGKVAVRLSDGCMLSIISGDLSYTPVDAELVIK